MSHTAAVYTVRVRGAGRGKRDDFRPFGDINNEGASLVAAIAGYIPELKAETGDGAKDLTGANANTVGEDLQVILTHGQRGVAGPLVDPAGTTKATVQSVDTLRVTCGALFRLPQAATLGWLAVHINNNRGIKTLLADGILRRFRDDFPKLILEVEACQLGSVLKAAVDEDRVDKVKLLRVMQVGDSAARARGGDKWVRQGVAGRLELDISSRGGRVIPDLLRQYLNGQTSVWNSIVEFDGMTFDQAKVEVQLENGTHRTFNIEKPDSGHPLTEDLFGLEFDSDGAPTAVTIFAALASMLDELTD